MKTLRPKSIQPVKVNVFDEVKEVISGSLERYNRMREGILRLFKNKNLAPVEMYAMAGQLELVGMVNYQTTMIDFVESRLTDNKDYSKTIKFGIYKRVYDNSPEVVKECWKKLIEILEQEKVKALELCRISSELKTSAMENFIQALDAFITAKLGEQ